MSRGQEFLPGRFVAILATELWRASRTWRVGGRLYAVQGQETGPALQILQLELRVPRRIRQQTDYKNLNR